MSKDDQSSDTESFKSFEVSDKQSTNKHESTSKSTQRHEHRFSPEEEQKLLSESNAEKKHGNTLFGKGSFENAVLTYDRALATCPNYLDYEIAVLRSNIAACHLKLEEWKQAVESATKGIDCLERLEPLPQLPRPDPRKDETPGKQDTTSAIEEVDDTLADRIENLRLSGHTIHEVRTLQIKLLLRRAKAKTSLDGWADLQAADEDYRTLLLPSMQVLLTNTDRNKTIEAQRALAPRLNTAREKEVAEMMGKLKGLGNTLLKPFGMSTDNFHFVKDEKTGGYSMNFEQNPGKT